MTKLLSIIPAFGVCFAGGMLLCPVPLDRTQCRRVLSQVEPPGDGGYAAWKGDAELAATAPGNPPQAAGEAKALAAKADEIRAVIGEIESWFRDSSPLIKARDDTKQWVEMVRQDSSYKMMGGAKAKLDQVIGERAMLKDMAWKDRREWLKRYEDARKEHADAMSRNLEKLKVLRAQDPRGKDP